MAVAEEVALPIPRPLPPPPLPLPPPPPRIRRLRVAMAASLPQEMPLLPNRHRSSRSSPTQLQPRTRRRRWSSPRRAQHAFAIDPVGLRPPTPPTTTNASTPRHATPKSKVSRDISSYLSLLNKASRAICRWLICLVAYRVKGKEVVA